ncbi:hypothetical protein D9M69_653650 [compost metagenome]
MMTDSLLISSFDQSFFCWTSPFGPNCTTIGVIGSLMLLDADQSRTPLVPAGSWICAQFAFISISTFRPTCFHISTRT